MSEQSTPAQASALLHDTQKPQEQAEPTTRFCPGCGSIGPVPDTYRDCCPDGGKAREIPASLATQCHDLFQLALGATDLAPDLIAVPRDLIGAACHAISSKRDAPQILAKLRRYTTGTEGAKND